MRPSTPLVTPIGEAESIERVSIYIDVIEPNHALMISVIIRLYNMNYVHLGHLRKMTNLNKLLNNDTYSLSSIKRLPKLELG